MNEDFPRAKAKRMARAGMPHHQIAFMLGITTLELRERFAEDMRRAEIEANLAIWDTLFRLAKSGKSVPATIFWLRTRAGAKFTSNQSAKTTEPEEEPYVAPPLIQVIDENGVVCE